MSSGLTSAASSLLQRKRLLKNVHDIPEEVQLKLRHVNIREASQLLALSQSELIHTVGISSIEAVDLIRSVSQHFAPRSRLAIDLFTIRQQLSGRSADGSQVAEVGAQSLSSRFVSTGVDVIDMLLCGGLNPGGITEILGTNGAGKTEFCLSIAARCLVERQHEDSTIVFIDADGSFSAQRLLSLIRALQPEWTSSACEQLCNNALVYQTTTVDQLLQLLKSLEDSLIERNTALICIDSIDSIVLRDFTASAATRRTTALLDIASTLKYIAETLDIPVICANHLNPSNSALKISARLGSAEPSRSTEDMSSCVVALGVVWGHAVNTRLLLQETSEQTRRLLTIAKCPYSPVVSVPIMLTDRGVVSASEDEAAAHLQPRALDSNFWEGTRYSFG